jgi:hypothetical protein
VVILSSRPVHEYQAMMLPTWPMRVSCASGNAVGRTLFTRVEIFSGDQQEDALHYK